MLKIAERIRIVVLEKGEVDPQIRSSYTLNCIN